MADGICTVDGCEKPLGGHRRTYCEMHYYRIRRGGTLEKRRVRKVCRECGQPAASFGLCQTHYMRQRRADDARPRCTEPDCTRAVDSRGYCTYHYARNCLPEWLAAQRENPARRAKIREWQRANPERMAELHRRWKAANPEIVRESSRRHSGIRRARKRGLPYEVVDFAAVLAEHGMVCHICGDDIVSDADLEFDHVVPLARGGPHLSANIRPAHAGCNRKKGARLSA